MQKTEIFHITIIQDSPVTGTKYGLVRQTTIKIKHNAIKNKIQKIRTIKTQRIRAEKQKHK